VKTKIIGISGTNGSGKDTIGKILADTFGYIFVSVTDSLRAEASKRGLVESRESTAQISAEWRREFGMAVLVDKAVDQYAAQLKTGSTLAMASLRHPAEADRIHELGGTVIWLDADPRIRYERIQANAETRNRTAADAISFEQFLAEEATEMHPTGDDATLNMAAVKAKADVFIVNDGNNIEALVIKLAQQLKLPLA
jgi:dephospho-CoA kinase